MHEAIEACIKEGLLCEPESKIGAEGALFYDLCKHRKWHKIQNRNRAGKAQGGLLPIIAY